MLLKTAEEWRLSEAALDFAERCITDPVFKRNVIFAVWHTRGYNVIAGAPIPIGTNVTQRMGEPTSDWVKKYQDLYEAEVQKLLDEEGKSWVDVELQREAQQQAEEDRDAWLEATYQERP